MAEPIEKILSRSRQFVELTDVDEVLKDLSRLLKKLVKSSWIGGLSP